MRVSVLVSTFGPVEWKRTAQERAIPSAEAQAPYEVLHVHGRSLHEARNEAAERASGDWLCFLDADDELEAGFLEAMRAAAPAGGNALLTPAVRYIRGTSRRLSATRPRIWPAKDLREGNWLVIGTLLERALFHQVGGFRDWPLYEDYDLWARCWIAGATIVEVPDAVYVAHVDARSRNRAPRRSEKMLWHQAIGNSIWPDLYDAPTDDELSSRALRGQVRRRR